MSAVPRPRPLRRGVVAALIALVAGAGLAAPAQAAPGRTFVAFGDSYTSGLGMPDQRATPAGEPRCFRSERNYPSKVAERLGLGAERSGGWADFSCSNATISGPALLSPIDLLGEVALAERAGALGDETRFVTFTGGGNDRWDGAGLGLFAGAVICLNDPSCSADPPAATFGRPGSVTTATFAARTKPAIDRIRALAPKARIVLVGYPEVLPTTGALCRTDQQATVAAAPGGQAYARAALGAISSSAKGAAKALDISFADTTAATSGHDICKPAGTRWYARTGDAGADPVHPIEAAHTAIAKVVYAARPALPRATVTGPSTARVGRTARFRAANLVRAPGYRARITRRMTVAGRSRSCSAPLGSARTASGSATFSGRIPSRLTCAGASGTARRPATPAGRYALRVCAESSSGACRSSGSTATRTVRVRR